MIGVFTTKKFPKADQNHKYAILIAARNEETVIGNLIDSIHSQDYDPSLITVFVIAHNCTDSTALAAKHKGAICYSYNNSQERTKGYALKHLVECIKRDYGIDAFEGYIIFDADNLLKKDYVSRMNEAFDAGETIITSYRHSKNMSDNWISASYSLHWLRTVRNEHRAKSLFKVSTRIQGTGFLVSKEVIRDGWNYVSLTEDRALSADSVVNGYRITYVNDAVFYDEQPVDLRTAMRQRIRWAKGHLQAFAETGPKLFFKALRFKRGSFNSFDMLTTVFPKTLIYKIADILVFFITFALLLINKCTLNAFAAFVISFLITIARKWLTSMLTAVFVFFIERKRIMRIPWYKKLWFCFMFPMFDIMGSLALLIALFTRVEWKPIPHNSEVSIFDIERK